LTSVIEQNRAAFATRPETGFHIRWLAPTAMDPAHPLVTRLADSVSQVTHRMPTVVGAPYACDLFALQQVFNMPAVVFGPRGGNAHAGDEYLELSTVFEFWGCLLAFVINWCGVA
jgi:acetylornithine deacetylase